MIILKVTKDQGFTLSLEDKYFEKPQGWGQIDPSAVLGLKIMRLEQNTQDIFFPTVEIIDYNVMIDGQNFFDQPVKNSLRTYANIRKITTEQVDHYATNCLLLIDYF